MARIRHQFPNFRWKFRFANTTWRRRFYNQTAGDIRRRRIMQNARKNEPEWAGNAIGRTSDQFGQFGKMRKATPTRHIQCRPPRPATTMGTARKLDFKTVKSLVFRFCVGEKGD
ncbi:hypothetical protein GWI33_018626 [Rhynchophorus ferrugineus]|uniref:Uncharacterized protein n=1 Tax=Rhynchophorus ferrugineus TaxID=354439 RepID=A0A834HVF9_RHYFE|nr:hypothetical protein GWI33_018626 [Rhynchophorus ferrugineus]